MSTQDRMILMARRSQLEELKIYITQKLTEINKQLETK